MAFAVGMSVVLRCCGATPVRSTVALVCLGPFGVSVGGGEGQGGEVGEAAGHGADGLGGDAVEVVDGFAAGEGMAVKLGGTGYGYGGVFLVVNGYDHLADELWGAIGVFDAVQDSAEGDGVFTAPEADEETGLFLDDFYNDVLEKILNADKKKEEK